MDAERFVKLFMAGLKQATGLSKAGLFIFEVVYSQLRERPNNDKVEMSFYLARKHSPGLVERTYQRGLRELLNRVPLPQPVRRPVLREYPIHVQR